MILTTTLGNINPSVASGLGARGPGREEGGTVALGAKFCCTFTPSIVGGGGQPPW